VPLAGQDRRTCIATNRSSDGQELLVPRSASARFALISPDPAAVAL
jgi:hypothetical protein